jgi:glucosamine-6-phosphate deaminase
MKIRVFEDPASLSLTAASDAARLLRRAIADRGAARLVAATGTSQIAFLDALCAEPAIDWPRVELFHLDEYLGLPPGHGASFRTFLMDRLVARTGIKQIHLLDADEDPNVLLPRIGAAIASAPIDVAFAGVGENGHLAFNDPPADFETQAPFLIVSLDEACRRQQVGEGWFGTLDEVPTQAITMSVRQILKAQAIVCLVSGARKAHAVAACFGDEAIRPSAPASILRQHAGTVVYLDRAAASGLQA